MALTTTLIRMYLTRSFKPFKFNHEYDQELPYSSCNDLGLYVHIPFCKQLCSFCPYCKVRYEESIYQNYISALIKEIELVGKQSQSKKSVTSLYFGGGTPALALDDFSQIINMINQYFIINEGIGIELHPDNVTIPVLKRLKELGVTKISIGIQSFQDKYQTILERKEFDVEKIKTSLQTVPFETISMDFIFALPNQTFKDLKNDIDLAFSIGANHVAIYPFIDFTFTNSKIKTMDKKAKRELLDNITIYCLNKGYSRTSIWTFSHSKQAQYSSMTRTNYLGFGCSSVTLLKDQFKINTFSLESYCQRINNDKLPTALTLRFSQRQRMLYYLFWMAYSTKINSYEFERFFQVPLNRAFKLELFLAKKLNYLNEDNGIYSMTLKGAFYYHYYENYYTLSYIDKMWNLLRNEAFPKKMTL